MDRPSLIDIRGALKRIESFIHCTPVLTCSTLNNMCGAELFFKCENLQKGGAFKIRGAANAVFSLDEKEIARGVVTHSSGNHAAALALAARWREVRAYVVMPDNASTVKKNAVADYGAEIIPCEPTLEAREEMLAKVQEGTGAYFIHPYNDYQVIAGQGTAALELCREIPGLDVVVAPVGGGGLLSGTALAVSEASPGTLVVGAEPEMADDAYRSLKAGRLIPVQNPQTVADGLRTSLGNLTFPIIRDHVQEIITVTEKAIVEAMRLMWERMKIVVEPSGAAPLAALLPKSEKFLGKRVGIIVSGGNVDLDRLPWGDGF